jgi:hypothetical protein
VGQYKSLLTRRQKFRLLVGLRQRKARMRGARAVSLLKKGNVRAAAKHLIAALIVWPLLLLDLHGILLAIKELDSLKHEGAEIPVVWPEWDE